MKWSELPKEYQDLENKFSSICYYEKETMSNYIEERFRWENTPQGHEFWLKCYRAKFASDLPKIEVTDYPDIKQPKKKERYFIVFFFGNDKLGNYGLIKKDGKYPKHSDIKNTLFERTGLDLQVTNIIELSESDYNDFIA